MKKIISILLLFFATIVSWASQVNEISLNGQWNFNASKLTTETEVLSNKNLQWDTLSVPSSWDTRSKYANYVGKAFYQRSFSIPKNWKGSQIRIKFDAVYEYSKVWLNGKLIGEHKGGYTPFEFNITEGVNLKHANSLLVMADNTYRRGAWWAWGGLNRKVSLIRNESVRFVYQHISAIPDFKNGLIRFTIKYCLENNSNLAQLLKITSNIIDADGKVLFVFKKTCNINANDIKTTNVSFVQPLSAYKLWHFDHPNRYKMTSKLLAENKVLQFKSEKFGIRKLEARGEQLFMNNEPVYMNGFNRVHDHPDFGNTEPDELIQKDIKDMKALGGVFSRMMHAPLAENLLNFCDSIGYMVIEEIPVWGDDDVQSFPNNPVAKQWMKEMIERDYNHPSVVGWSVGNELRDSVNIWEDKTLTPKQYSYINSMLDYIDELDTTRLKTYVSLTSYLKNANMNNEPFDKLDLLCINSYGDAVKAAKNTNLKFPGKPIFISEIGLKQIGPAPDGALSQALIDQLNELPDLPFVVGSSLWSYNDYRSNYKGTPASGFREWGVVDEYRKRKKAYYQIKTIYSRK